MQYIMYIALDHVDGSLQCELMVLRSTAVALLVATLNSGHPFEQGHKSLSLLHCTINIFTSPSHQFHLYINKCGHNLLANRVSLLERDYCICML